MPVPPVPPHGPLIPRMGPQTSPQAGHEIIMQCESDPGAQQVR